VYSIYLGVQILHSVAAGLNIIMKQFIIQMLKYLVAAVVIYTVLYVISGCTTVTTQVDNRSYTIGPIPIVKLEF
jgi:hypothetical protein